MNWILSYCHMLGQTIWLQLSSPFLKKSNCFCRDLNLGPRPQSRTYICSRLLGYGPSMADGQLLIYVADAESPPLLDIFTNLVVFVSERSWRLTCWFQTIQWKKPSIIFSRRTNGRTTTKTTFFLLYKRSSLLVFLSSFVDKL